MRREHKCGHRDIARRHHVLHMNFCVFSTLRECFHAQILSRNTIKNPDSTTLQTSLSLNLPSIADAPRFMSFEKHKVIMPSPSLKPCTHMNLASSLLRSLRQGIPEIENFVQLDKTFLVLLGRSMSWTKICSLPVLDYMGSVVWSYSSSEISRSSWSTSLSSLIVLSSRKDAAK